MKRVNAESLNYNLKHAVAEIIVATETPHSDLDIQLTANSLVFGIYRAIIETCRVEGMTHTDSIRAADEIIETICLNTCRLQYP